MNTSAQPNRWPALACLLVALGGNAAVAQERNDWSFDVVPYLWVASVDLEMSVPNLPTGGSDVNRYDTRISAGAMLAAQARYRSFGVFADFAWLRLDTEAVDPAPFYSEVDLRSDFIHGTAALTYQLPLSDKWKADLLAGARIWNVQSDASLQAGLLPQAERSVERTWADPIIGASVSYDLNQRWALGAKGVIGGFGVSADLAAEAFAGVTYRITDWCSATVGYRYLYEDYERGDYELKLHTHGFLVGLGFRF